MPYDTQEIERLALKAMAQAAVRNRPLRGQSRSNTLYQLRFSAGCSDRSCCGAPRDYSAPHHSPRAAWRTTSVPPPRRRRRSVGSTKRKKRRRRRRRRRQALASTPFWASPTPSLTGRTLRRQLTLIVRITQVGISVTCVRGVTHWSRSRVTRGRGCLS